MDIFKWIEKNLDPEVCTSDKFIYDEMDSQSGYSLPIIYQPFDGTNKYHWMDRGALYDFLYSVKGEGKTLLDFGPGDGWPSLIIAPYVKEVIGLDASQRRVKVCKDNAIRLGLSNTRFLHYVSGARFPFEDNSFDGIMAASSIEQTPSPKETLKELYRVLKPGGAIRISYEAMNRYKSGKERELWILDLGKESCKIVLYNRNIEEEWAEQYGINMAMSKNELITLLCREEKYLTFETISWGFLYSIKDKIISAEKCRLSHPSGRTIVSWMKDIGFKKIIPTHNGLAAAIKAYEELLPEERPVNLPAVDEIIKEGVRSAILLEAPLEKDPMITAIK